MKTNSFNGKRRRGSGRTWIPDDEHSHLFKVEFTSNDASGNPITRHCIMSMGSQEELFDYFEKNLPSAKIRKTTKLK